MNKQTLKLNIKEKDKENLKIEFEQLKTVEQKYQFWNEKFNFSYFFWPNLEQDEIHDFMIYPKDSSEIEILNKLIFKESKNFPYYKNLPKLKVWKKEFIENFEKSVNKENIIDYELKRIDDYVASKKSNINVLNYIEHGSNLFLVKGFEQYFLRNEELNWGERVYETFNLLGLISGVELAKYRESVREYKEEKKQPDIKLTGEQKVLALYYLKFCSDLDNGSKKGKVFEYFIGNFKHKSILKIFSNITDYETEKNLDILIDFFRWLEINSIARILEDKLSNLSKTR